MFTDSGCAWTLPTVENPGAKQRLPHWPEKQTTLAETGTQVPTCCRENSGTVCDWGAWGARGRD